MAMNPPSYSKDRRHCGYYSSSVDEGGSRPFLVAFLMEVLYPAFISSARCNDTNFWSLKESAK